MKPPFLPRGQLKILLLFQFLYAKGRKHRAFGLCLFPFGKQCYSFQRFDMRGQRCRLQLNACFSFGNNCASVIASQALHTLQGRCLSRPVHTKKRKYLPLKNLKIQPFQNSVAAITFLQPANLYGSIHSFPFPPFPNGPASHVEK